MQLPFVPALRLIALTLASATLVVGCSDSRLESLVTVPQTAAQLVATDDPAFAGLLYQHALGQLETKELYTRWLYRPDGGPLEVLIDDSAGIARTAYADRLEYLLVRAAEYADTAEAWQLCVDAFPQGKYSVAAGKRLTQWHDWQAAVDRHDPVAAADIGRTAGHQSNLRKRTLEMLAGPIGDALPPAAAAPIPGVVDPGTSAFERGDDGEMHSVDPDPLIAKLGGGEPIFVEFVPDTVPTGLFGTFTIKDPVQKICGSLGERRAVDWLDAAVLLRVRWESTHIDDYRARDGSVIASAHSVAFTVDAIRMSDLQHVARYVYRKFPPERTTVAIGGYAGYPAGIKDVYGDASFDLDRLMRGLATWGRRSAPKRADNVRVTTLVIPPNESGRSPHAPTPPGVRWERFAISGGLALLFAAFVVRRMGRAARRIRSASS
ncbi:MAG: hypothetical protein AB7K09_26010 [Planctomycetota bacterium]